MRKAGELSAVMVGDTPWDVRAALEAEVKTVAVLTGGFGEAELRDAGAVDVFESLPELTTALDRTPLA
jgi:phosphoglycolate phosphatase